jgi:hypothetical protein
MTSALPFRSRGSLYEFVRATLAAHGGTCTKQGLLSAIQADPDMAKRLERSQEFARLLQNVKHSGFIELDGDTVRRTGRRVGRRHA